RAGKIRRMARRRRVAELYCQGKSQRAIAQLVKVSQPVVAKDLAIIRKEWVEKTLRDFDERKAEELAKLDMVEATAWKSFILSQQGTSTTIEDEVSERVYFGKHVPIEESVFLTTRKSRRKVINQQPDGNARWIAIINRVIETRLRVLGALRPDVLVPMN